MATRTGQITLIDVTDIENIDIEYYASTSNTSLIGGSWQTTAPSWTSGKYIWQRTVITKTGTSDVDYLPDANGVCVTGNTGDTGKGVSDIQEFYYQSTSATTPPSIVIQDGAIRNWTTEMPSYRDGYYYWTCSLISWDDGSYTHTSPICANGITDIAEIAEIASQAVSSKITTFYQTTAPTSGMHEGDLWLDSDNGNKLYRYNGSTWISVDNTDIAKALTDAANAQKIADGKIVTYYQADQPTGDIGTGDLWIDSDDGNSLHRYNGTRWIDVTDSGSRLARMYMAFFTNYGLYISEQNLANVTDPTTLTSSYVNVKSNSIIVSAAKPQGNVDKASYTEITSSSFKIKTPKENLLVIDTANNNGDFEYTFVGEINSGGDQLYLPFSVPSNTLVSSLTATLTVDSETSDGDTEKTTYTLRGGRDFTFDDETSGTDSNHYIITLTGTYATYSGLFEMTYTTTDQLYNFTIGSRKDDVKTEFGDLVSKGHGSASIGNDNDASGIYAFSEGQSNYAVGDLSVAMGVRNSASGNASIALGDRNLVGDYAFAAGQNNVATARSSVAIGRRNNRYKETGSTDYKQVKNGEYSVALGLGNVTKGKASTAVGAYNIVRSRDAFASGLNNTIGLNSEDEAEMNSSAAYSVAFGTGNIIRASHSAAIGNNNEIRTGSTHGYCIGRNLIVATGGTNQLVTGKYNTATTEALFVVGNGSADGDRKNALVLDNSGNLSISGNFTVGGSNLYIVNEVFTQTVTVPASGYLSTVITMAKSGYTLIGIVGISTENVGSLVITKFYNSVNLSNQDVGTIVLKNLTANSIETKLRVKGIYRYRT